jgi:MFS transporter, MHS family, proline/betaine transporter
MKKVIVAGMIGNGLEWYDFMIYGLLATTIGAQFFPVDGVYNQLILSFGVFAAGFLMRPLGAVIFGCLGDKIGRKYSLAVSILVMAFSTAAIGLIPNYATIGILAPLILTLLRLIQGLALGGELSVSIAYVVEHGNQEKRGLIGSSILVSMMIGILIAKGIIVTLQQIVGPEAFQVWGWRIPFILGVFIGLVGFYIRTSLGESPVYTEAKQQQALSKRPVQETFFKYGKELLVVHGLYCAVTIPFYGFTIFMKTYLEDILNYSYDDVGVIDLVSSIVLLIVIPISAQLSDRWGRRTVLGIGCMLFFTLTYPAFALIQTENFISCLVGQILLAITIGVYIGPVPAVLIEAFPTSIRSTAAGLASNITATLLGGTSPAIITLLIQKTGSFYAPCWYFIASAVISAVSLLFYPETNKRNLNDTTF